MGIEAVTTLSAAVQDAIQKDLPGIAASELAQFIKNAELTARDLEGTKRSLEASQAKIAELTAELQQHRRLDEKQATLDATARSNQEIELALLKKEAGLDAKVALAELAGVKDTTNLFLRNVTVRQTVVADVSKPLMGSPGGNGYHGTPGMLSRNYDNKPDVTTTTEEQQ